MQLMLPIFPVSTEMITPTLGIYRKDEVVTYLHCGMPVFTHLEQDHHSFRFITSKFILQKLCRMVDVSECFHVSYDSVKRYVKRLEECGDSGFFTKEKQNGGSRHKLLPHVLKRMQGYIDEGKNNCEIARLENVSEGSVRYAMKSGALKKNLKNNPHQQQAIEPSAA